MAHWQVHSLVGDTHPYLRRSSANFCSMLRDLGMHLEHELHAWMHGCAVCLSCAANIKPPLHLSVDFMNAVVPLRDANACAAGRGRPRALGHAWGQHACAAAPAHVANPSTAGPGARLPAAVRVPPATAAPAAAAAGTWRAGVAGAAYRSAVRRPPGGAASRVGPATLGRSVTQCCTGARRAVGCMFCCC